MISEDPRHSYSYSGGHIPNKKYYKLFYNYVSIKINIILVRLDLSFFLFSSKLKHFCGPWGTVGESEPVCIHSIFLKQEIIKPQAEMPSDYPTD